MLFMLLTHNNTWYNNKFKRIIWHNSGFRSHPTYFFTWRNNKIITTKIAKTNNQPNVYTMRHAILLNLIYIIYSRKEHNPTYHIFHFQRLSSPIRKTFKTIIVYPFHAQSIELQCHVSIYPSKSRSIKILGVKGKENNGIFN